MPTYQTTPPAHRCATPNFYAHDDLGTVGDGLNLALSNLRPLFFIALAQVVVTRGQPDLLIAARNAPFRRPASFMFNFISCLWITILDGARQIDPQLMQEVVQRTVLV